MNPGEISIKDIKTFFQKPLQLLLELYILLVHITEVIDYKYKFRSPIC